MLQISTGLAELHIPAFDHGFNGASYTNAFTVSDENALDTTASTTGDEMATPAYASAALKKAVATITWHCCLCIAV
jgi:hypothetical protein